MITSSEARSPGRGRLAELFAIWPQEARAAGLEPSYFHGPGVGLQTSKKDCGEDSSLQTGLCFSTGQSRQSVKKPGWSVRGSPRLPGGIWQPASMLRSHRPTLQWPKPAMAQKASAWPHNTPWSGYRPSIPNAPEGKRSLRSGHIHLSIFAREQPTSRAIIPTTARQGQHAVFLCVSLRVGSTHRCSVDAANAAVPKSFFFLCAGPKTPRFRRS